VQQLRLRPVAHVDRSSARTIHYYRCIGSDAWRRLGGPVCDNCPVRQDLLDQVVWTQVVRLLQSPSLIQNELDRRLAAARTAHPTKQRERALLRDLARTRKSIDRLLTAYQGTSSRSTNCARECPSCDTANMLCRLNCSRS
jgi:hypothetical protein